METKQSTAVKTKWSIDPSHSEISFKIKHLMITNVKGSFKEFEGTVTGDGDTFNASDLVVKIKTASIDTGDQKRDEHLRTGDFFDAEKNPEIVFKGRELNKNGDNTFDLKGDLTIRGVTRPVELDVEYSGTAKDPYGNTKAGFLVEGRISRKEWGLNWNAALETGGMLVGDEVRVSAEVQLIRK